MSTFCVAVILSFQIYIIYRKFSTSMFSYGIFVSVDAIIRFKSCQLYGQNRETHVISHGHLCRDNVCPPLSSTNTNFSIELYETKSVDRKFLSIDTMLKFYHQKINQFWKFLLLIDLETSHFLYNCANL